MNIEFIIEPEDIKKVREFYDKSKNNRFVDEREKRKVEGQHAPVTGDEFWKAVINALLTTQQRFCPRSSLYRYLTQSPFPLSISDCKASGKDYIYNSLTTF